jgi:hypothetical protein
MAWGVGEAIPAATAVTFMVRHSARPCPFSLVSKAAGICCHGRLFNRACRLGWLSFTVRM